jgi:hypothetical protein
VCPPSDLDRQAVEQLLRAYAGVTVNRRCIQGTQVGGVQLMPGDIGVKPRFQLKTHIGPIPQVDAPPLVWPV